MMRPYLKHNIPSRCLVSVLPHKNDITTFGPRTKPGLNLLHGDSAVNRFLTRNGVMCTKHLAFSEVQFYGVKIFENDRYMLKAHEKDGNLIISLPDYATTRTNQNQTTKTTSDEVSQPLDSEIRTPGEVREMLTHYPPVPSTFGESENAEAENGG